MKNYKQEIENIKKKAYNHIDWHDEWENMALEQQQEVVENIIELSLEELSNLISEILDSCPLEKKPIPSEEECQLIELTLTNIEMATKAVQFHAYNKAVSKYEAWKKEVKENLGV